MLLQFVDPFRIIGLVQSRKIRICIRNYTHVSVKSSRQIFILIEEQAEVQGNQMCSIEGERVEKIENPISIDFMTTNSEE